MNPHLLNALIRDLDEIIDDSDNKPNGLIGNTRNLGSCVQPALGAQHPRLGEVVGHLNRGSASSAVGVLREIQTAAAQTTDAQASSLPAK